MTNQVDPSAAPGRLVSNWIVQDFCHHALEATAEPSAVRPRPVGHIGAEPTSAEEGRYRRAVHERPERNQTPVRHAKRRAKKRRPRPALQGVRHEPAAHLRRGGPWGDRSPPHRAARAAHDGPPHADRGLRHAVPELPRDGASGAAPAARSTWCERWCVVSARTHRSPRSARPAYPRPGPTAPVHRRSSAAVMALILPDGPRLPATRLSRLPCLTPRSGRGGRCRRHH